MPIESSQGERNDMSDTLAIDTVCPECSAALGTHQDWCTRQAQATAPPEPAGCCTAIELLTYGHVPGCAWRKDP